MKEIKVELAKKEQAKKLAEKKALELKQKKMEESKKALQEEKLNVKRQEVRSMQEKLDPTAYTARVSNTKSMSESILKRLEERTSREAKEAANLMQRSPVADKLKEAVNAKNEDRATSIVMRTLKCDQHSAQEVLKAYRLM